MVILGKREEVWSKIKTRHTCTEYSSNQVSLEGHLGSDFFSRKTLTLILYGPSPLCPHTVPFSPVSPYCTLLNSYCTLLHTLHGVELALVQTCASGLSHWLVLDGS